MSSEVIRIHSERYERHITIDIDVIESDISNEAYRLWSYVFSRPKDWTLNTSVIEKLLGSAYKVEKARKELQALGLLIITPIREGGKWAGHSWRVKGSIPKSPAGDQPAPVSPEPEIPGPVTPAPVTPGPDNQVPLKETPGVKETEVLNLQSSSSGELLTNPSPQPLGAGASAEDVEARRQHLANCEAIKRELKLAGMSSADAHAVLMREGLAYCQKLLPVLVALTDAGLGVGKSLKLIADKGFLACQQQADWLPYREKIDDPTAYLAWAIENDKPKPKALPISLQPKAEAAPQKQLLPILPPHELDAHSLTDLGRQLWPGFVDAVDAGLTELTVSGPPCPIAVLETGIYPITRDKGQLYVTRPDGSKLLLGFTIIALFNWPGKGQGAAA